MRQIIEMAHEILELQRRLREYMDPRERDETQARLEELKSDIIKLWRAVR